MGIDVHELKFLCYARKFGDLKKTITVGRQKLFFAEADGRDVVPPGTDYKEGEYCERLLMNCFGSQAVDAIDFSAYEGASLVHDMNLALPPATHGLYDTVIDSGSLEHIYNVPQALRNCSCLCKPGGQILHMSPANSWCGHGFWQFSPELFFSLYSDQNGYRDTEVFLASLGDKKEWFKVKPTVDKQRLNVFSAAPILVLARTVRKEMDFSHNNIQQTHYIVMWNDNSTQKSIARSSRIEKVKDLIKQFPFLYRFLRPVWCFYFRFMIRARHVCASNLDRNPKLVKVDIASLL